VNWTVPFFDLSLGDEEKEAVAKVLESNWLTSGEKVSEFEADFASALGITQGQAVAVSSCTAALHLALESLGITAGDEVICPSLTFVATANAVRYTGATPVFADICSESEWTIAPEDIEAKITSATRAIVVVHYGGYPCRMSEICQIAKKHGLKVVEDACHGPLGEWQGRKLGTIGDMGCFSFFSNKNMTTAEGGMVVTRDPALAERIKLMRSHGMTSSSYERFKGHATGYDVVCRGYNYRMDEIRAALGVAQLKKLPQINSGRRLLVAAYREVIRRECPDVAVPFEAWEGDYGYHIFPVLLSSQGGMSRERIVEGLAERGVQTSVHYRPIHTFSDFKAYPAHVPKTDAIAPRILSLPLYPSLSAEQISSVAAGLASLTES